MVKRVILEEGFDSFTDMNKVFEGIENMQVDYNFLITDFEGYPEDKEIENILARNYTWLSGEELTKIVQSNNFQWSWGVLSAFDKNVSIEEALKYELPYADGNSKIWEKIAIVQNPLAEFEIIAFDSSLTMISSKNNQIVERFKKNIEYAKDL